MKKQILLALYVLTTFFAIQIPIASSAMTSLKQDSEWFVICQNLEFTDVRRGIMLSGRSVSFDEPIYMNLEWVTWLSKNLNASGTPKIEYVEVDLFADSEVKQMDILHGDGPVPTYTLHVYTAERADGDGLGGRVILFVEDQDPIDYRNCWFADIFTYSREVSKYID